MLKRKLLKCTMTIILLMGILTSCKKDKKPNNTENRITASVLGRVMDEFGVGIVGATATASGKTSTTDINGIFIIKDVSFNKNYAVVKISKTGYFDGSRTFVATAGKTNNVKIRLFTKSLKGSFTTAIGGTINITSDVSVAFPVNAIEKADGTAYTGTVNVYAAYLDPTDANLSTKMPGDLTGIQLDNTRKILRTYGMINVELEDASGNKLNIIEGKEATLSASIPTSIISSAPATIPLWSFDTNTGLWNEEGLATLSGGKYTGNVKHFSWWNLDAPGPIAFLSFRLVDNNGYGIGFTETRVSTNPFDYSYGTTDNAGNISGNILSNSINKLEYQDQCGNWIYIMDINPISTFNNLGDIIANPSGTNEIRYNGRLVDCNGNGVSNGYAYFKIGTFDYFAATDVNGNFSTTIYNCSGILPTITGYDIGSNQHGFTQRISTIPSQLTSGLNIGDIPACASSTQEFIKVRIEDDSLYTFTDNLHLKNLYTSLMTDSTVMTEEYNNSLTIGFLSHINSTSSVAITNFLFLARREDFGIVYKALSPINLTTTVTVYPAIGGYIEGYIDGDITDNSTGSIETHHVFCSYRIKRTI